MEGKGPAIRLVGTHQGSADPKTVQDNVWQKQRMPLVQGIEIVGAHDEADGIEAVRTMQLTISQVVIRHTRHAIHLVDRNRNVIISDCHLYENRGVGVFLDDLNLHQINLSACHISYNQGGGFVSKGGNVRNIHIAGCDIEANVQNVLIDSAGTKYGTAEVAITGCTIQHSGGENSTNVRFIGARNTISSGYRYNLRVEDSQNIVVGPNVLGRNPPYRDKDTCDNGVLFRNCVGGTISGLHIHQTLRTDAGMILDGCRRFHVTGCTFLDCEKAGMLLKDLVECRVAENMLYGREGDKEWVPTIIS
ncbi:unnamed protein product, partial [Symbiodinium sp. CCMP2456]